MNVQSTSADARPASTPSAYWERARALFGNRGTDPSNIATASVDAKVAAGAGERVAFRFISTRGLEATDHTYRQLAGASDRFAGALGDLALTPGDTVALLAHRVPRLYVAALGAWKAGGVVCPLFEAFGPEPIRQRLELGTARVLVTDSSTYQHKVEPFRSQLAALEHVIVLDDPPAGPPPGTLSMAHLLTAAPQRQVNVRTRGDDPAILHFTSGTTGTPKGALHVHGAVVAHLATALDVFSLSSDDVFWCTADPGWVTGTSYGIIAPLAVGATAVVDEAEFDAERWYSVLERERVTVLYTAPTAVRMLMRAGSDLASRHDLSALRLVASVGEPLSAEAVNWGADALGLPIRDTWWQTETGAIMIATPNGAEVRAGSMGRPIDGVAAGLLACDDAGELLRQDGHVVEVTEPDQIGMLALRPGWPSMFREYLGAPARYAAAFDDGWYLSGDLARRDADGWYWFVGRVDDVIKTAGHLIGPFEVEQVLNTHPDVLASGVYGMPDPLAGQVIHAEVVLRDGAGTEATVLASVKAHARRRLGAAVAPRSIIATNSLPCTRSGKVMRRLLRARALGVDDGDTSALDQTAAPDGLTTSRGQP